MTAAEPNKTYALEPVHPLPDEAWKMPYAPAIRVTGDCDLLFLSAGLEMSTGRPIDGTPCASNTNSSQ